MNNSGAAEDRLFRTSTARRASKSRSAVQAAMTSDVSISLQGVFSRSKACWHIMQNEAHGTAARRFELIFSSQPTQNPSVPALMRRSALRTSTSRGNRVRDRRSPYRDRCRAEFDPVPPDSSRSLEPRGSYFRFVNQFVCSPRRFGMRLVRSSSPVTLVFLTFRIAFGSTSLS